ncbi:MAG: Flp family type IVb pilin [Stappiaceae bacterium]
MVDLVKNFWANESGGTAIEYSMIATAISIAILASLLVLQDTLSGDYYDRIAEAFTNL